MIRFPAFTTKHPIYDYPEPFGITLFFRVLYGMNRHNSLLCEFNLNYLLPPTQENYAAKTKDLKSIFLL